VALTLARTQGGCGYGKHFGQDLRYGGSRPTRRIPDSLWSRCSPWPWLSAQTPWVFSVLNAAESMHPLHVPQAESLYGIQHGNEASSYQSYPDYLDLRDRNGKLPMIWRPMMPPGWGWTTA